MEYLNIHAMKYVEDFNGRINDYLISFAMMKVSPDIFHLIAIAKKGRRGEERTYFRLWHTAWEHSNRDYVGTAQSAVCHRSHVKACCFSICVLPKSTMNVVLCRWITRMGGRSQRLLLSGNRRFSNLMKWMCPWVSTVCRLNDCYGDVPRRHLHSTKWYPHYFSSCSINGNMLQCNCQQFFAPLLAVRWPCLQQ